MAFAIKAEVRDPRARTFVFSAQKTMYGGKQVAEGDTMFVFASENEGGRGLVARGLVTSARGIARKRGVARQTPRVSVTVRRTALAKRPLGRSELRHFTEWEDGQPGTELNFKLYRQATNKIIRVSDETAAFLGRCFSRAVAAGTPARSIGTRPPRARRSLKEAARRPRQPGARRRGGSPCPTRSCGS